METTAQHHAAISRFLDRLKRRERWLLVLQALGSGISALALLTFGCAIALSVGSPADAVAVFGVSFGIAFVGAATWWSVRGRWERSGLRLHHARLVEARLPGLRGRLITVLDRGAQENATSGALLHRAAEHAGQAITLVEPAQVHSGRQTRAILLGMLATLLTVGGVGSRLPVGPADALSVLLGASAASVRLAGAEVDEAPDSAVVGDITLRYIYPAYTGLDPKTVPNSDGTVIAPPGTTVAIRARTARPFQAVALEIEGREPIDAVLRAGRDIDGQFSVDETGQWRFLLFEGDRVTTSPWYALQSDADAPPVIVLSKSGELLVPLDSPLDIGWQATDDYGIVSVALVVERDGERTEHMLREPIDLPLTMDGLVLDSPRGLGLRSGETVTLRVVAVDNDRLEGGNMGESEPLTLKVLGPRGYGKNLTAHYSKLLDAFLDGLADFLEEPVPPVSTRPALVQWAHSAAERFDPVRLLMEQQWGDTPSSGIDGMLVSDVLDASASLFRFTLTTFDKDVGAVGQQPVRSDIDTFSSLHADTIVALETASFVLDTMIRNVGVMELTRMARKTANSAMETAEQAQSTDDVTELSAQLDRLERQLGQLRKAAASLSDEALREFTNSTLDQASGLIAETRKALGEGRTDEARQMMESLAEQLAQFAESLEERQQRGEAEDDEMKERFTALMDDLSELARQQDDLANDLASVHEQFGPSFGERMDVWSKLDTLAEQMETVTSDALRGTEDGREWRPFTLVRLQELAALGAGIRDSVRARDVQGSTLRVSEHQRDVGVTEGFVRRDRARTPSPRSGERVQSSIQASAVIAAEMAELLAKLDSAPGQSSPEMEAATRALSERQGEIQDWQRELMDEVKTIENAIPTANGEASRSMSGAGTAMEHAREFLEEGMAVAGEGHQRQASGLVRETKEHLQQSMQDQQRMQQAMRQMQGEKGSEDGEEKTNDSSRSRAEIPSPELFKTPEEYREALLEGMAGDVPDEFKGLKARFYEDLVRQ